MDDREPFLPSIKSQQMTNIGSYNTKILKGWREGEKEIVTIRISFILSQLKKSASLLRKN